MVSPRCTLTATTYAIDAIRGVDPLVERSEFFGFLGPDGADETIETLVTLSGPTGGRSRSTGTTPSRSRVACAPRSWHRRRASIPNSRPARTCGSRVVPAGFRDLKWADRIDELLEHAELTGVAGAVAITAICIVFSVWFTAFSNVLAVVTRGECRRPVTDTI